MSKLGDVIVAYKQNRSADDKALRQAICDALFESGFKDVDEVSVAIVAGHDVVFTAYVCVNLNCEENPRAVTPDDIELDGSIDRDSIILYA